MRPALFACLCVAAGCSNGGASSPRGSSGAPGDAGNDGAGFVPAAHPPLAQVISKGGPILAPPRLVAISFAGDGLATELEAFTSAFAPSAYFAATGKDYGVTGATSLPPVRVAETAGAQLSDGDVRSWLTGKLDGTHPEFPPAAADIVYVLYYPPTATITYRGAQSCDGFSGYHDETPTKGGVTVSFAVVARCTSLPGLDVLAAATATASHEILETATDPLPTSRPAYSDTDDDDPAWPLIFRGGEIADLCEPPASPYTTLPDFPYTVHRIWSNTAAKTGHDPCVPAPPSPYFASVPVLADTVTLTVSGAPVRVRGVAIPVGQTRTIDLALFSEAQTIGPWTIRALDLPALSGGAPELSFAVTPPTGNNGDVAKLAITVLGKGALGGEPFVVESTLSGRTTFAVGLVGE